MSRPKPISTLAAFALLGLFLVGCNPVPGKVLFQSYHDPFDTAAPGGFSEIAASDVQTLQQILGRAQLRSKTQDDLNYSPVFLPFGTILMENDDSKNDSCVCHDHRVECDGGRELDIADQDIPAYRALMNRIDSLDRARRGVGKRSPPPVGFPEVPVH